MTQIISAIDRWEYVTCFDYEWDIIRRSQRRRRAIWVRALTGTLNHWSESVPSIDLLPCAPLHPHARSRGRDLS